MKDLQDAIARTKKSLTPLQAQISEIDDQLQKLKEAVSKNSKILGATLTKTYLSPKLFEEIDVVILDEASMAMLPSVFCIWVSKKISSYFSGDYLQLAPIVNTNQSAVKAEIGVSVFESSGVQEDCDREGGESSCHCSIRNIGCQSIVILSPSRSIRIDWLRDGRQRLERAHRLESQIGNNNRHE